MEKVEERRLKKAESIHKVEKILNYVFDNRQDETQPTNDG